MDSELMVARDDEGKLVTLQSMYTMLKSIGGQVEGLGKQVNSLKKTVSDHGRDLYDIENEYPLLPPEADDLSKAVKVKGVEVLGGKKSAAYQDKGLRRKVYQDIYCMIKREYGLLDEKGAQLSYKKLKRKNLKGAFITVSEYVPSSALREEIETLNELDEIDE